MNMPNDCYHAIIVQRGDAEAAALFADDCRKKDATLERLSEALADEDRWVELRRLFAQYPGEATAILVAQVFPEFGAALGVE